MPLHEGRALWVPYDLNLEQVQQACPLFVGTHDFRAFATQEERQTRRIIYECRLEGAGNRFNLLVRGESFLRHQIRAMVGTMLMVGSDKLTLHELEALLQGAQRAKAGPNVKPHGLHFEAAGY